MYPILPLPFETWGRPEQLGTKRKFWFECDGIKKMFKEGRPGTGENWSEKATSELAGLLGLPHASYDLATWADHNQNPVYGVITPSFVPKDARLVLGNEILGPLVTSELARDKYYKQSYHTTRLVMAILGSPRFKPPACLNFPFKLANDMFVGYVLFDAWIANQDRHSENWGLIASASGLELTPTYDHASSLGRNESDEKRQLKLVTKDFLQSVDQYVTKARSALYRSPKDAKPLSTFDAFIDCAKIAPKAAEFWLGKLENIAMGDVKTIFAQIPPSFVSDIAIEFAIKILELNKNRLLELKIKL